MANISDANVGQAFQIDWSSTSNALLPPSNSSTNSWTFSPSAGIYSIGVTITDNGSTPLSSSLVKTIVVSASAVPILDGSDTDGDGTIDSVEGYGDSDNDGIPNYLDAFDRSNLIADKTGSGVSSYVLQAEASLKIVIGNTAIASGVAGAALTDNEISAHGGSSGATVSNSVDNHEHIGGIYDFTISGMIPGSSTLIVIPLQLSIPKNAAYRKYDEKNGWIDFVSDGSKNQVYSAKGSLGVCPEALSSEYKVGLQYLDNCIQILIEDGGVNDQDGVVNGRILDPGAISITLNEVEEPVVEKGGSLSVWFVSILASLFFLSLFSRFRRINRQ